MSLKIFFRIALAMAAAAALFLSPAFSQSAELTPEEIKQEASRYQALGGIYRARGFDEFPSRETPFFGHPGYGYSRLTLIRHRGKLLYQDRSGVLVGHSFGCGRRGTIYVELWLPGGDKGMLPFAWQDPALLCSEGGEPSDSDPLYIDITGDGNPEVKFASVGEISRVVDQDGVKMRMFSLDLIPAWIERKLGGPPKGGPDAVLPGAGWIEPVFRIREQGRREVHPGRWSD